MYLETPRLILRDYEEADFESYYRLKSSPQTMYYLQDIKLTSLEEAKQDFRQVMEDQKRPDRRFYFFHVEDRQTHEQLGSSGYTINHFTPAGKLAHAGYFFYPRYWNKGYATEALKRILRFAFEENSVYRVSTGCLAENVGSEQVMIKCGMVKEAQRPGWEWHDGKLKTRLEYRLLKPEWEYLSNC